MKKFNFLYHTYCPKSATLIALLAFLLFAPFAMAQDSLWMRVSISLQQLTLFQGIDTIKTYPISSSKHGIGSEQDSYKTPLGLHGVIEKYGDQAPEGTIFISRIRTSKLAPIELQPISTGVDFVTTRILSLEGLEPGLNQGEGIDSYLRYIYIHGTHEEGLIGTPASNGCIRMTNKDVIELYDLVPLGTTIRIDLE